MGILYIYIIRLKMFLNKKEIFPEITSYCLRFLFRVSWCFTFTMKSFCSKMNAASLSKFCHTDSSELSSGHRCRLYLRSSRRACFILWIFCIMKSGNTAPGCLGRPFASTLPLRRSEMRRIRGYLRDPPQ